MNVVEAMTTAVISQKSVVSSPGRRGRCQRNKEEVRVQTSQSIDMLGSR
jgi:hypothetical protein